LFRADELVASMNSRCNSYDNAAVENVFHSLKVDSVHGAPLMHPDALRRALFEYIDMEYDRPSSHSALG